MLQHKHCSLPRQSPDVSEIFLIPSSKRLFQQALSYLFQRLVSDILADKIPLYQLPDREHPLVHGERGEFGVQSYIYFLLVPQQAQLLKGILLALFQKFKVAGCPFNRITVL